MIRHGQTGWNAEGRLQGRLDSHLSEVGGAQTERLAEALAAVPLRAVYSSPLLRALDTASVLAARHGLRVLIVDALKEISLGDWEGMTMDEVAARYPDRLAARRRDPLHVAPEGGETILDVEARVLPAVHEIVAGHPDETVAVVAHGAVNKAILLSVLGSPLSAYAGMRQDNAAINVLEWDDRGPRVVALNETGHLDGLLPRHPGSSETPAARRAYTPRPPQE